MIALMALIENQDNTSPTRRCNAVEPLQAADTLHKLVQRADSMQGCVAGTSSHCPRLEASKLSVPSMSARVVTTDAPVDLATLLQKH